ncbi:MAG: 50S ribosomal protein L14e [Candidatus Woesearchaeota archaeon]|nr:MAG: 50S ribosomal protein L14e [Candidatus Woesearchaeota archaeon]
MVLEIGRVVVKLAGRDANKAGVVIKKIDNNYVLIDGNVRRKKCNVNHLEPLDKVLAINEEESTQKIRELLKKEGFSIDKKGEKRVPKEKPKAIISKKEKKPVETKKAVKKTENKDKKNA